MNKFIIINNKIYLLLEESINTITKAYKCFHNNEIKYLLDYKNKIIDIQGWSYYENSKEYAIWQTTYNNTNKLCNENHFKSNKSTKSILIEEIIQRNKNYAMFDRTGLAEIKKELCLIWI